MLEADRVGQYGFFGEYCAIKGSSEQPCSVRRAVWSAQPLLLAFSLAFLSHSLTCTASLVIEQVQATTNVTLTKIPDSEYRDFLRIYPSFRNDIKGYIDRRYPPDHKLVQQVAELRAWEAYKEGTTRCISRTAIPPSMRRFGREVSSKTRMVVHHMTLCCYLKRIPSPFPPLLSTAATATAPRRLASGCDAPRG